MSSQKQSRPSGELSRVEALARDLYATYMSRADAGQTTPAGHAEKAIKDATDFYAIWDKSGA